jgi:hypothetical protein
MYCRLAVSAQLFRGLHKYSISPQSFCELGIEPEFSGHTTGTL